MDKKALLLSYPVSYRQLVTFSITLYFLLLIGSNFFVIDFLSSNLLFIVDAMLFYQLFIAFFFINFVIDFFNLSSNCSIDFFSMNLCMIFQL